MSAPAYELSGKELKALSRWYSAMKRQRAELTVNVFVDDDARVSACGLITPFNDARPFTAIIKMDDGFRRIDGSGRLVAQSPTLDPLIADDIAPYLHLSVAEWVDIAGWMRGLGVKANFVFQDEVPRGTAIGGKMPMPDTATPSGLSLSDLNTSVNHEPRILDLRLAERLGFANPLMVRKLIERNRDEIESHGIISMVEINHGGGRGRPGRQFWLNEGQALVVCMLSRTPNAAAIRTEVIGVYIAYRRGEKTGAYGRGADVKSVTALVSRQNQAMRLTHKLQVTGNPVERRMMHRMLDALCVEMGLDTPPLDQLGRDGPTPSDLVTTFWRTVADLSADGIDLNHSRDPSLVAIRLLDLREKSSLRLDTALRRALKADSRFVAYKVVLSALKDKAVKCWVFSA